MVLPVRQKADNTGDSKKFVVFILGMIRDASKELRENQNKTDSLNVVVNVVINVAINENKVLSSSRKTLCTSFLPFSRRQFGSCGFRIGASVERSAFAFRKTAANSCRFSHGCGCSRTSIFRISSVSRTGHGKYKFSRERIKNSLPGRSWRRRKIRKSSVLAGGGVSSLPLSSIVLDRSGHGVHQRKGGGVEHDQCGQKALLRKKITK